MIERAETSEAARLSRQSGLEFKARAALRSRKGDIVKACLLSTACLAGLGLAGSRMAQAGLTENWETVPTAGGLYPASPPSNGTPYTITTSGAGGLGTWTAISSDASNAYYAVSATGFGAGGSGNSMGEGGASHDNSAGSMILQSPAFTLSDAASGGSISMTYIGGANGSNVPGNISGLGTDPGNAGFGFMGVALVDPSGNIVASSSNMTGPGSVSGNNYNLTYSGLSPTTPYTFALIDDGTRNSNWGWNGVDNISIPSGSLAVSSSNIFNWVAGTGPFNTGSNWDQGVAPSNVSLDHAIISNGGTATIGSSATVSAAYLYAGSSTGTKTGNVTQTGGSVTLNNDLVVGNAGGTGTYNLSGGTISTGNLVVGNGTGGTAGVGTFIHTAGDITVSNDFEIGQAGGVGTYNMSGGTITYSGTGPLNIRGTASTPSVLTLSGTAAVTANNGSVSVAIGELPASGTGTGIVTISGTASLTTSGGAQVWVGDGGAGATGILNMSGGSLTCNSWISIGRSGAVGVVNLSGTGVITKVAGSTGDVSFGGGTTGVGTLNQTGGTFTDTTSQEWIGETTGATGVWNMSGGTANTNIVLVGYSGTGTVNLSGTAQITTNQFIVGYYTGATGIFNLNGGTLSTAFFQQDSGTATVNLNGGVVQASADTNLLLNRFSAGSVNALAGGAIFDSNGHTATITSSIGSPSGVTGSFTKKGAGVLILAASNTYSGATNVAAGTLQLAKFIGTPVPVGNFSFEAVSASPAGYIYSPSDPSWTYISDGGTTQGAGITNNTTGFKFNGAAPDGTQAAFIQRSGAIEQSLAFPVSGSYTLTFYTEQRADGNGAGQALNVSLDDPLNGGINLQPGGFTPGTTWAQTTYVFSETSGSHLLKFSGLNPNNDDSTAYVDDVALYGNYVSGTSNYIPATSPVVISDNATLDLNGNPQPIGSLTGTALSSVTLGSGILTTGNDGTNTTFAGTVSGTGSVVKTRGGTQTFSGSNTYSGGTTVNGGKLVFSAPGALPLFTSLTIGAGSTAVAANYTAIGAKNTLFVTGLTIAGSTNAWTGTLDLGNNDMVVRGGNLATVSNQLKQGYNSGNWQGTGGILSTAAAASTTGLTTLGSLLNNDGSGSPLYTTFDGQAVTATDVLIKYTYYGDANLDGHVDGSDYTRIDNGFNNALTGWSNGDFNYDGVINGSDYTLIDNAFNTQGGSLDLARADSSVAQSAAQVAGASAVPEPAMLSLFSFGAVALLAKRRRNR